MADKRMIPMVTFEDPNFGKLSSDAKVMFIGMVVLADDEGRLRANPTYLTSRIFGYMGFTPDQSKKIVDEVVGSIKSCKRYVVDGEEYIQLTKWNKYQTLRKDRVRTSMYPSMSAECQPNVNQMTAEAKLSKAKLSKAKLSKAKLREVKLSKDNITAKAVTKTYGNAEVNDTLSYFKEKLKLPMMDGSKDNNRRYAYLLIKKFNGLPGVRQLIDFTSEDEFWKNQITSLSNLYYKGVQIIARKRGNYGNKYRSIDATKYL